MCSLRFQTSAVGGLKNQSISAALNMIIKKSSTQQFNTLYNKVCVCVCVCVCVEMNVEVGVGGEGEGEARTSIK